MKLTDREKLVLCCLIQGDPDKMIAERIGIHVSTVRVHVKNVFRKIGVINRTQAALWGWKHDIIAPDVQRNGRMVKENE